MNYSLPNSFKLSAKLINNFIDTFINFILYERCVYPPQYFTEKDDYKMKVWKCDEESVVSYLSKILVECKDLISKKSLEQIVVIVYDGTDHLPKERWALRFDDRDENPSDIELSVEDIKKRFSDILKQIKASSNMLPLLNGKCVFDVLLIIKKDCNIPDSFEQTTPQFLTDAEDLPFQAVNAPHFKLDAFVTYKV